MFMFPTIKLNIERWKYNPTFELYVSNMGHIRNKSKADIAPKIMENGYVVVYVNGSINGYMLLHRVVMLTWKPTPEAEKLTVDHLDHNKRNNALSNLEWVTHKENLRRAREDYIGTLCPCGCEFVETLSFKKSVSKKTKPNANDYRAKMKTVKEFLAEPDRRKDGNANRPSIRFAPSISGYREVSEAMCGLVPTFTISGLSGKVRAMIEGANQTGVAYYCGLKITPIFPEENK
jgi:hypothetical protein